MNTIIEDKFTVNGVNKDGKFFKKVSRIDAKSEIYDIEMTLDINSEIYQMEINKDYYVVIASGMSSSDDEQTMNQKMEEYQYVMYGKVFRVSEERNGNDLVVHASFGGLMMVLKGSVQHLKAVENDLRVYILVKAI